MAKLKLNLGQQNLVEPSLRQLIKKVKKNYSNQFLYTTKS